MATPPPAPCIVAARRARRARKGSWLISLSMPRTLAADVALRFSLPFPAAHRNDKESRMEYRRLGSSGLRVSELSLGSWITYHNQVDATAATEMLAAAMDAGVNFFDNAEVYAKGQSEVVMGEAFKRLGWSRLNYVVSTKFFWGLDREGNAVNRKDTLNRKYLMQAIDGSLARLGLDFVDLVFC